MTSAPKIIAANGQYLGRLSANPYATQAPILCGDGE